MTSLLRTDREITEIYHRQIDTVYRICYSFMKNKPEAEDMVQETFLRLISSGKIFENQRHEKAWLIVTASNLCKDQLKRLYRTDEDGDGPRVDMQDRDIEWLAEHINFSVQTKLPDVDAVLPQLQKADAEYEALLDADDAFAQDSYQKLRVVLGAVTEYALLDLDGDGTDECVFWDGYGNPSLYTMKDGKTAPVLTQGDKAFGIQGTVFLCENRVLKTYEEVGQAYKLYCFYTVEQGNLIVQNRLVYDIANDAWGLSLSGIHIDKSLTKEEAEAILDSYREIPFAHLPIDTFPEDK